MHIHKKTKIVATIGPATETPEMMKKIILAGANILRFNMKHNTKEWHIEKINQAQKVANELQIPLGLMIDLQGPEIRVETYNKEPVIIEAGEEIKFATELEDNYFKTVRIDQAAVFDALNKDDEFSIDDGKMEFTVTEKGDNWLKATARGNYTLQTRKGLNLVGKDLDIPSLVDADLDKLDIASLTKVDFVALSFVRRKKDLDLLREEMKKRNIEAHVVSKVESRVGVENIDEIIENSDAIIIARGDLGIEIPFEQVTFYQKEIVTKCREAHVPVIVATQMLTSMVTNPRPTRAEVADVSNAIFDGADAVWLSEETTIGKYPVEAIEALSRIAKFNEGRISPQKLYLKTYNQTQMVVKAAISMFSVDTDNPITKAIVFTQSGYSVNALASYRPRVPIIAASDNQKTVETLTMVYGVEPIKRSFPKTYFDSPVALLEELKTEGYIKSGEKVLILHGRKWMQVGDTNALSVVTV